MISLYAQPSGAGMRCALALLLWPCVTVGHDPLDPGGVSQETVGGSQTYAAMVATEGNNCPHAVT